MKLDQILQRSEGVRRTAAEAVAARRDDIVALSRDIHAHPEMGFHEARSSRALCDFLEQSGFAVERGYGRLPTAFTATCGTGELVVGIVAEYDALPNGHACGHNIILGAAVGAGIGLQAVADELGITVKLIGTPAEEGGGGKLYLLQDGAFDDVHCALMIHGIPDGEDRSPIGCTSQAVARWRATFTGKSAHAAGAPHLGVNALDAATIANVSLGLLRQQIPDGQRAAMLIREGGLITNIIPERVVVEFECRAPKLEAWHRLYDRVVKCFEAGALATGCTLEIEQYEPSYEPLLQDEVLGRHWNEAYGSFGRDVSYRPNVNTASTDFGNVGQVLPALHPWIALDGVPHSLHSDGFRDAAAADVGMDTLFHGALGMAFTVIGAMQDPESVAYLRRRKAERRPIEQSPLPGADHVAEVSASLGLA